MVERRVRFDWYQTESDVVLTVMQRNTSLEKCRTDYGDGLSVRVDIRDENEEWTNILSLPLAHEIDVRKCTLHCRPAHIEVKMRKKDGGRWETIENTGTIKPILATSSVASIGDDQSVKNYPSSHPGHANWDKLALQVKEDEEKEAKEGDGAVNALFSKIYTDADDDVKKAMMKSYMESGGTVLSTNWAEVSKEKVECKPPEGMEFKKWN